MTTQTTFKSYMVKKNQFWSFANLILVIFEFVVISKNISITILAFKFERGPKVGKNSTMATVMDF